MPEGYNGIRPTIMLFAKAMEQTMRRHDIEKGDFVPWEGADRFFHDKLREEFIEVMDAYKNTSIESSIDILGELVDLGNICMMWWHVRNKCIGIDNPTVRLEEKEPCKECIALSDKLDDKDDEIEKVIDQIDEMEEHCPFHVEGDDPPCQGGTIKKEPCKGCADTCRRLNTLLHRMDENDPMFDELYNIMEALKEG